MRWCFLRLRAAVWLIVMELLELCMLRDHVGASFFRVWVRMCAFAGDFAVCSVPRGWAPGSVSWSIL